MHAGTKKRIKKRYTLSATDFHGYLPLLVSSSNSAVRDIRQPTTIDVIKAPIGINMLEVRPSKLSNSVCPKNPIGHGPIDIALRIPITQQNTDTIHAAFLRDIFISCDISDVPISCIEIVEVSAARVRRAKNIIATTYATICGNAMVKTLGSVWKIRLGPASGRNPTANAAGNIISPAMIATPQSMPAI